jgi:hypothetical protein
MLFMMLSSRWASFAGVSLSLRSFSFAFSLYLPFSSSNRWFSRFSVVIICFVFFSSSSLLRFNYLFFSSRSSQ